MSNEDNALANPFANQIDPLAPSFDDWGGWGEETTGVPYLATVSTTSKLIGTFDDDGLPYQVGEFVLEGDHGVGAVIVPVAIPFGTLAVTQKDLDVEDKDFSKRVCNSNDMKTPVRDGITMSDPRTGRIIITDFSVAETMITPDGRVGGCAACPLSKWIEVQGKRRPPVCKQTDMYVFYVLGMYQAKQGVNFGKDGAVGYYRANGPVSSHFEFKPINKLAAYSARSYTGDGWKKGTHRAGGKENKVTPFKALAAPYTPPVSQGPRSADLYAALQGFKNYFSKLTLLITEENEVITLAQADKLADAQLGLFGYTGIRLSTESFENSGGNQPSLVVNVHAPDANTPFMQVGEANYDQWIEYRTMLMTQSAVSLLGWRTSLPGAAATPLSELEQFALYGGENRFGDDIPGFENRPASSSSSTAALERDLADL